MGKFAAQALHNLKQQAMVREMIVTESFSALKIKRKTYVCLPLGKS
jgi:hypothetical protein